MTLSEELTWRGFKNQTTYKDITVLDGKPITFYLGMDPSADSLQAGNLAVAMMIRHFIDHGHNAIMLVGGATGLIGDPDGKDDERELKSREEVERNKKAIAKQYDRILNGKKFDRVDNYDWFKDMGYLDFLRDVGKHVPMSQMLGREFVQSRIGEQGSGISYAEFSYSLIQGYDFLHLYRTKGATLQLCGSDQWGNSIAGVELIRRIEGAEAHIWSAPLVINKTTGKKFGKSEGGAIWLDAEKTTPTAFYQFWVTSDDASVEDLLKIYTLLPKENIDLVLEQHAENRGQRYAQKILAAEVTRLIHGEKALETARLVTECLTGERSLHDAKNVITDLKKEIPSIAVHSEGSLLEALVSTGLATSNGDARRLLANNAISCNGQKVTLESIPADLFVDNLALLRRGKAFKDSALLELR
ncbi:MAG: tyrosine--tRNA ligase [Candidatus Saccharimonadales bacterium]